MTEAAHDSKSLAQERAAIFNDLYTGVIPSRVPVSIGIGTEVFLENAGLPTARTAWTHAGIEEAVDAVLRDLRVDTFPGDSVRPVSYSEITGSRMWRMGRDGFMQHPEVVFVEASGYDEFIEAPFDYILEKLIRAVCTKIGDTPAMRGIMIHMALTARGWDLSGAGAAAGKLGAKYGLYSAPMNQSAFCLHPLDFIASRMRGFTGISNDLKRMPGKVLDAARALLPLFLINAVPETVGPLGATTMTCHMPTFMRTSEFEGIYYPVMSDLIHATAQAGQAFSVFCEDNWNRYLDHLQDLPQGTRLQFEYGDPAMIKSKLGRKFVINGLYPSVLLLTGTRQQCVDKAKELLDVMAPGGGYIFNFDKSPTTLKSTNLENLKAVTEYVSQNASYANAGEKVWTEPREASVKNAKDSIPAFRSKYFVGREDYLAGADYPVKDLEPLIAERVERSYVGLIKEILRML